MPTLVNSIIEKIDEIRVSRDSLKQIISDNMNVDTSTFKLIECMNYVENNILKPAYAIRPKFEEFVDIICPLNVRLTNTSWVSLDFAMNDISLEKEFVYLFGISASSLRCYLTNGKLCLHTGTEIVFNKEINLDTNRHTLAFGFTDEVREDGHKRFQVEFDGTVVYNDFAQVPNFNLPFSLFDIPNAYEGTYEDYIAAGGITYLINNIEYTRKKSLFDVFALNVYDMVNGERTAVKAYSPGLDSKQKTAFLENISGEYQYPESGRYLYIKILGDTTTVITNSSYEKPLPPGEYYLKPSEGAILPTDIVLTSTTQITMYIKGIDGFDNITGGSEEEILKKKVMLGAQPNLFLSPINGNDVNRGLPWWNAQHNMPLEEVVGLLSNGTIGMCVFGQQDHRPDRNQFLYSSSYAASVDKIINTLTMDGEHVIRFGQDVDDVNNINLETDNFMKRVLSVDGKTDTESRFGPDNNIHVAFNNSRRTPICFFGTYNNVETTPNDVIALGYQNALNQIGYTTGIRYGVKRIDISVRNADATVSVTHRLISATDSDGVNYFKDTVSGSSYYPYNGTLDKI